MTKVLSLLFLLIIFGTSVLTFDGFDQKNTLKSIFMIFRHGDRTPQKYPTDFYPKDPYLYYDFSPVGYGGLTNVGKKREYELGASLRKRYNKFLNQTYHKSDISVVGSNMERTKMSSLLVLAGLYPPKGQQVWEDSMKWQPIPINYIPSGISLYIKATSLCPTYKSEYKLVNDSAEYKKDLSQFDELMRNLYDLTGREMKDSGDIIHIYHTLTAEMSMGLPLPEWTKPYYPNGPLINGSLFYYKSRSYTPKLRKLNGGMFLRKIVNDMNIDKDRKSKERPKINLYSVHESNIAAVLYALDLWKYRMPEYSCGVIFELHEKDSKQFIKILYYKGIPSEYEVQVIPGCTEYCPVEEFLNIYKDVLPDDLLETCYGPPSDSLLIPKSANPVEWMYAQLRDWFSY